LSGCRKLGDHVFDGEWEGCSIEELAFSPAGDRLVGLVAAQPGAAATPGILWRGAGALRIVASAWADRIPEVMRGDRRVRSLQAVVWKVGESGLVTDHKLDLGEYDPSLGIHEHARSVSFSPDGALLATATFLPEGRSEVRLWDLATGTVRQTMRSPGGPHRDRPYLAFTPDGRRLWAGGRLWDVATGLELLTLTEDLAGGRDEADPVAFLVDGDVVRGVFTAGDTVRVYVFDGNRPDGRSK
jgi:WD40 repeat protein